MNLPKVGENEKCRLVFVNVYGPQPDRTLVLRQLVRVGLTFTMLFETLQERVCQPREEG